MSPVCPRYAKALLSVAASDAEADAFGLVLSGFSHALTENNDFHAFMLNPSISRQVKKEALAKLMDAGTPKAAADFLSLLVDKDRLSVLPGICEEYENLKAQRDNVLRVTVLSGRPLDGAQLEAIGEKYRKMYGAPSVNVEFRTDSALLGGVCVQIGDERVDDTLAGRLKSLRAALKVGV